MVREYKDSGITWIGRIPKDWNTTKLGSLYTQRNEKVSDKDYAPLSVTMQGILPQLETAAKTDDGDNRKLVKKGDFAINSRSDRRGSCGISPYDGSVSLINTILKPRGEMNPNFYNWLFHTSPFADEFYKWGHGIVDDLWTTRWQEMKNISVVIPSLEEQQHIADYLDKKCAEIDGLIELQEQMIAQLSDYKQSVITEAVTKGINPDAQLVPSGIDRIGDVPEEWKVCQLKRFLLFQNGQDYKEIEVKEGDGFPVYGSGGIFTYAERYMYDGESVLFGRKGTVNRPLYVNCKFWTVDTMYYTIPKKDVNCKFMYYVATTLPFDKYSTSTALPSMTQTILGNLKVAIPAKDEQSVIVEYLDKKCGEIDNLIAVKQQKIETLKEYKKSLIFECVTGKKEIN